MMQTASLLPRQNDRVWYIHLAKSVLLLTNGFSLCFVQDDYVRTWDENQGSNDSKSLSGKIFTLTCLILELVKTN